jgi:AraC family transcriptional regulator
MSTRKVYEHKINRVLLHICKDPGQDFSIDSLCRLAGFSRFHFLRLFKSLTGETVGEYIKRMRLEKAAYQLIYNPESPITSIALDLAFSSSQNFAKAFKGYFGISPSQYRSENIGKAMVPHISSQNSTVGNINSTSGKEFSTQHHYLDFIEGSPFELSPNKNIRIDVQIKEISEFKAATIFKQKNYNSRDISQGIDELLEWAKPLGLISEDSTVFSVFFDNAAVTPEDKQRFAAALKIPDNIPEGIKVNQETFGGGKYAVYHAEIDNFDFYSHWNLFLRDWFPDSGYEPADGPSMEFYRSLMNYKEDSPLLVDICIPVKNL